MIFQIIITLLLTGGLLLMIFGSLSLPSVREKSRLERLGKPQKRFDLERSVILPIARRFEKFIRLNSVSKEQIEKKLKNAGYTMTAELYTARNLTFTALLFLFALVFIPFRIPLLYLISLVFFVLGLVSYFKMRDEADEKLKKKKESIKKELPQFMRTIIQSLKFSRDISVMVDKYRLIAGPELKAELDILLLDLKTINQEEALKAFADRIDIDYLTSFVNGLVSENRGVDQAEYLQSVERELKKMHIEDLKREAFKKPDKLHLAQAAVVGAIILVWMTAIAFQIVSSYLYTWNF